MIEHTRTQVHFREGSHNWTIMYIEEGIFVYRGIELLHRYDSAPSEVKLKAKHPNKTQAEALIKYTKKHYGDKEK